MCCLWKHQNWLENCLQAGSTWTQVFSMRFFPNQNEFLINVPTSNTQVTTLKHNISIISLIHFWPKWQDIGCCCFFFFFSDSLYILYSPSFCCCLNFVRTYCYLVMLMSFCLMYYDNSGPSWKSATVKALIMDPPKTGQPLYSGQITCPRLILP